MAGWVQAGSVVVPSPLAAHAGSAWSGSVGASGRGAEAGLRRRPPPLTMYSELPEGEVSIEEFERLALDRLRILKGIEDAKARGVRPGADMDQCVAELVERHLRAGCSLAEAARKDLVSHHVLRLAYCRTEELRRWFLGLETELFRLRFRALLPSEQRAVAEAAELPYAALSRAEFLEVEDMLRRAAIAAGGSSQIVGAQLSEPNAHESYHKVPFEVVPDLVSGRRVFVRAGMAYVPREALVSLVSIPFRSRLSKALAITARRWNAFLAAAEADRLAPVIEGLSRRYLGKDYGDVRARSSLDAPTASDIPSLDAESFPLCMHAMYMHLHSTHSMRHDGRMQLGLFLKGIGLPLDEAVRFWKQEMAPVCPSDKFDKEYLYNIRHNYGKEGNRKDYTPYTCSKIIASTPGVVRARGAGREAAAAAATAAKQTGAKVPNA